MARKRTRVALAAETHGPLALGALALAALLCFADPIAAEFAAGTWKSGALYSAIFGWSAIQTGFAFGVYGFVLEKTGGFMAAMRGTKTLERFEGHIKRANWTGFVLTFLTIPLIVAEPQIAEPLTLSYVLVAAWFSLFVWAFLAFLRLAYNFGVLASVKDKEFHGA